ncbi:MAG: SdpI family protein [Maricaulaceae bacterium]
MQTRRIPGEWSKVKVPASLRLSAFGLPLLYLAISIPLALRLIEPNSAYGHRTRDAFSSTEDWYELNAIAGWAGIGASLLALVAVVAIVNSGLGAALTRYLVALGVTLAMMVGSLAVPAISGA